MAFKLIVQNSKIVLKTIANYIINANGIKDLFTGTSNVDSNGKIDWTLQHYSGTAASFTSNNPILLVGQIGIETDNLSTTPKFKIGDGVTAWSGLPYANSTSGGTWGSIIGTLSNQTDLQTALDNKLNLSGSNANQDIDIGNNGLNAKNIKIKGTGGAGHLALKHQSSSITASTSESSLGADSSGNPVWKNDGNAIRSIQLDNSANTATNYTTPLDADKMSIWDVANSVLKSVTWLNIKATLKTYFDTIYTTTSAVATQITTALLPYALKESQLNSGGTITIGTFGGSGTNNDIRVSASNWFIQSTGLNYSTSTNTDFLDIPPSAIGEQRFIGLYGTTSNTIIKVEGNEDILATYPIQPANTALIGYVLITDAGASTTPDLSGYLLKSSKATQSTNLTGTNDTTYVTPLANAVKENTNRKSSSFTVSSTTTYPNTKALVDGLATKKTIATGNAYKFETTDASGNLQETTVTASRAVVTDANGLPSASATTSTEIGYVNGVTSSIQTQLNGKQASLGYTPANQSTTISTNSPLSGGGDLSTNRTLSISQANTTTNGYLSSTDWNTFNGKQNALGYTPVPNSRNLTINGTTYDLSADRTWTISTASNVAIKDEGSVITSAVTSIDFTGSAVTATAVGNDVTVNINAGGAASFSLFNYYNFI